MTDQFVTIGHDGKRKYMMRKDEYDDLVETSVYNQMRCLILKHRYDMTDNQRIELIKLLAERKDNE